MKILCNSCQSSFKIDAALVKPTGLKVRCSKCQQIFKVLPSDSVNRRKHNRINTINLISHVTIDGNGNWISQGLSKAVDISKGGMLLDTPHPIEPGLISLMAVDLDNRLIEIKGELVYCKRTATGMYHSGVKFVDTREQIVNFAKKLIKEYNHRKNNLSGSLYQ
jgi:predicted Zn finger-like uncharacterized protein